MVTIYMYTSFKFLVATSIETKCSVFLCAMRVQRLLCTLANLLFKFYVCQRKAMGGNAVSITSLGSFFFCCWRYGRFLRSELNCAFVLIRGSEVCRWWQAGKKHHHAALHMRRKVLWQIIAI